MQQLFTGWRGCGDYLLRLQCCSWQRMRVHQQRNMATNHFLDQQFCFMSRTAFWVIAEQSFGYRTACLWVRPWTIRIWNMSAWPDIWWKSQLLL